MVEWPGEESQDVRPISNGQGVNIWLSRPVVLVIHMHCHVIKEFWKYLCEVNGGEYVSEDTRGTAKRYRYGKVPRPGPQLLTSLTLTAALFLPGRTCHVGATCGIVQRKWSRSPRRRW